MNDAVTGSDAIAEVVMMMERMIRPNLSFIRCLWWQIRRGSGNDGDDDICRDDVFQHPDSLITSKL